MTVMQKKRKEGMDTNKLTYKLKSKGSTEKSVAKQIHCKRLNKESQKGKVSFDNGRKPM